MDSADPTPYHQIGSFDLRDVFYPNDDITQSPPHPWRLCARVVGDVVSFIVGPVSHPEPAWGDPRHRGSVTLPEGWNEPGRAGWYVGHLSPGEVAGLGDLTMTDLTEPPDPPAAAGAPSAAPATDDPVTGDPAVAPRVPTWIASAP